MATPFLFALREGFPTGRITLLSRDYAAELFRNNAAIDSLIECSRSIRSRFSAARKGSPRGGFDACFVLPPSFSAALVPVLLNARRRIGYGGQGREMLLTDALPVSLYRATHLSRSYVRLLERFTNREEAVLALPSVIPSESWRERAAGVAGGGSYFVLAPGATYGSSKVWPSERYASVAKRIMVKTGWTAAVVGRGEEREEAAAMLASIAGDGRNLAGTLSIGDLVSVLRGARLVIGNDSGPVHISAALAVPTVTIFGPTSVDWTAPRGLSVRIVRGEIECAPCFKRQCPHGAPECLTRVDSDAVYAAAVSLIEEGSR
jgi:heptosyltransferase-2